MNGTINIITRLLAAYNEAKAAYDARRREVARLLTGGFADERDAFFAARDALHAALTDDTIEALVKVAEVGQRWREYVTDNNLEVTVWGAPILAALATLDAIRPTPDQEGAEG